MSDATWECICGDTVPIESRARRWPRRRVIFTDQSWADVWAHIWTHEVGGRDA